MTILENAYLETRNAYRKIKRFKRGFEHQLASHRQLVEAKKRLLSSPDYTAEEKALIAKACDRVHPEDDMYQGDGAHYLSSGLSGLRCIEAALRSAGKTIGAKSAILDFPSGFGRVLRFVQVRFPDADITAAELLPNAVKFCRQKFPVTVVRSKIPITDLELEQRFDLIWCGSLLTHVDEPGALTFLKFFHDHLKPGGLCVFSTHGDTVVDWMATRKHRFLLTEDGLDHVIAEYRQNGYGYVDYPFQAGYGVSAVTRARMRTLASEVGNWREAAFLESGWDHCQDVFAYSRAAN